MSYIYNFLLEPDRPMTPAPFLEGSRKKFQDVYDHMTTGEERDTDITTAREWEDYKMLCPKSDSVQEFVNENPERFHIPLWKELFSSVAIDYKTNITAKKSAKDYISGRERTTASVKWHNRGEKLGKIFKEYNIHNL